MGRLTGGLVLRDFKHLKIGATCVVIHDFTDHDGGVHAAGEAWRFLGHSFVPYYDGLSLYILPDGGDERQIRLQWTADAEGAIIDALETYVQPV